jgi:hypothetical protein
MKTVVVAAQYTIGRLFCRTAQNPDAKASAGSWGGTANAVH